MGESVNKELKSFNWNDAPVICELNCYRWFLGQGADEAMNWGDAIEWCKSVGGELPPREILLMAYLNEEIKPLFKDGWHWSSTEYSATHAWVQGFDNGYQYYGTKTTNVYVRAVKKMKI